MKEDINEKKIKLQSKVILFILFAGSVSIVFQFAMKNIVWDIFQINNDWMVGLIKTDYNLKAPARVDEDGWSGEYPFGEELAYEQTEIISTRAGAEGEKEPLAGISAKISKLYDIVDKYSSTYFSFIDQAEIISKTFSKSLGMDLLIDAYGDLTYFQQDGRMMAERPYKPMQDEIFNIRNFAKWLDGEKIAYMYVMIPSPVDPEEEAGQIALGYEEYTNVMANELLAGLRAEGVSALDLRKEMKAESRSWTDSFFPYDHHMVMGNGLWAAGKVADMIDETMELKTDRSVFDPESYSITRLALSGDGGYYNTATAVYAGKTEKEMYHPLFETRFIKDLPRYGMTLKGDFNDVMYAMYDHPEYNMYNHGIQPIKSYENQEQYVAKVHILLLTESYSDVISPFLACAYSDIDEIDLRLFNGSLQAYIERTRPDLVVCMYSAYDQNSNGAEDLFEFN